MFYFYKTLKLRLKFVALPFPIFRILLLVYIYIYSQLFIRATHTSDFHASSFPRNWREIVEHQAFPRNQNVPQFQVDASTCVTQPGLERSVLFSFPFSFFLFFIHLSFSFYNAKNRDLALASISIVFLLSEIEISKGTSVRRYLRVRTTFYSKYIYRGNRSVASRASHSTHQLRCNVIVEQSLLVLLFPPFYSILDGIAFVFCAEIRFNF